MTNRTAIALALPALFACGAGLGCSSTNDPTDADGDVGEYPSIALSPDGNTVYVAYHDATNTALKFVRSTDWDETWGVMRTIDNSASVGKWPALAISGTGAATVAAVAYWDEALGDLRFACSDDNGNTG